MRTKKTHVASQTSTDETQSNYSMLQHVLVWAEEETIPASAVRQPKEQRLLEFPQTLVYSLLNISLLASPRYLWAQRLGTPAPDRGHDKKKVYSGTLCKRWQTQYIKEASSCGVILYDKNGLFERFQTWTFFFFWGGVFDDVIVRKLKYCWTQHTSAQHCHIYRINPAQKNETISLIGLCEWPGQLCLTVNLKWKTAQTSTQNHKQQKVFNRSFPWAGS